jgi:hypothetical protein
VAVEAVLPLGQLANSCGSSPLHESDPPKNAPNSIVLANTYHSSATTNIKRVSSWEKEDERTDDWPSCMIQDRMILLVISYLPVSAAARQYIIFAKYRHPSQGYRHWSPHTLFSAHVPKIVDMGFLIWGECRLEKSTVQKAQAYFVNPTDKSKQFCRYARFLNYCTWR